MPDLTPERLDEIEARVEAADNMRHNAPNAEEGTIAALDFADKCCDDVPDLLAIARRVVDPDEKTVRRVADAMARSNYAACAKSRESPQPWSADDVWFHTALDALTEIARG